MIGQINDLYSHRCEECGSYHYEDLADDDSWSDIYEQIAADILSNKDYKINADLQQKTAEKLISAVNKGFENADINADRSILAKKLLENVYVFSAAKSATQMKYYRDMMLGENGAILSKDSFVKKIADTGEIFNKNYLSAEYENAYYSTIMADQWSRYADDEILEYSTAGDSHVRASHKLLDKYTAPKADPFWKTNYPPNGWGCRCTAIPGKTKNVSERQQERWEAGINSVKIENEKTPFYTNVGLSAQIFDEKKHPYFKIFSKNEIEDVKKEVEKLTSEEIIQNQKDINLLREDDRWRKAYEDVKATDLEKKYPQLTLEELATIQHYTNMGYWDLNEALYTKRVFPLEEANERILNRALEKLPKTTELNVARGVPFDEEKYKKYADNIGKIVSHEGFTSTSTREDIAKAFGQDEPIMMFYIEHKNGRELRDISFFSETFDNDNEFEVLFKSNSKFKVKKIIPNGSDVDIYLEEID